MSKKKRAPRTGEQKLLRCWRDRAKRVIWRGATPFKEDADAWGAPDCLVRDGHRILSLSPGALLNKASMGELLKFLNQAADARNKLAGDLYYAVCLFKRRFAHLSASEAFDKVLSHISKISRPRR